MLKQTPPALILPCSSFKKIRIFLSFGFSLCVGPKLLIHPPFSEMVHCSTQPGSVGAGSILRLPRFGLNRCCESPICQYPHRSRRFCTLNEKCYRSHHPVVVLDIETRSDDLLKVDGDNIHSRLQAASMCTQD